MTSLWSPTSTSICLRCRLKFLTRSQHRVYVTQRANGGRSRSNAYHSDGVSKSQPRAGEVAPKDSSVLSLRRSSHRRWMSIIDTTAKPTTPHIPPEEAARSARQIFGDRLPLGCLSPQAYDVYERLYGSPVEGNEQELGESVVAGHGNEAELDHTLFRETKDGQLEVVHAFSTAATDGAQSTHDISQRVKKAEDDYDGLGAEEERFEAEDADDYPSETDLEYMRVHPLTMAGRFATSPTTIQLPRTTFVEPISEMLADRSKKHLSEAAQRAFGGPGLPYSVATPRSRGVLEHKAISLLAGQSQMTDMEADVYISSVMPGIYASVMSCIVEVRKRLGSEWLERLIQREGELQMLDAGAGGAAVAVWHEILRAEWQRTHEDPSDDTPVPLGKATVLSGSSSLRYRSSRLLDNTTFLPRLPDDVHAADQTGGHPRKQYDIIIAPHTLLQLREDYLRKQHVQNLWSLLRPDGGVLILIEKGLPRGFEAIAAARKMLLDNYLSSPDKPQRLQPIDEASRTLKETGMIIAPCTNHEQCPMYTVSGRTKGRSDFCHFSQRYIRPPYLQRILNAKDRNHEDVRFSYVAVQRGRDQRQSQGLRQGPKATDAAFAGFEAHGDSGSTTNSSPPPVNTLSLPRAVWPPIKRRGHVILDLCTPAGKLERWTVPRSFSKQAFRDARKSEWGDLWALGAKTRTKRNVRLGEKDEERTKAGKEKKTRNNAAMVWSASIR